MVCENQRRWVDAEREKSNYGGWKTVKIYEAAQQVLRDAGRPMHVKAIHDEIVKRGLFKFGAKEPVAIVGQTLRKKSRVPINKGGVLFEKVGQNTYQLAKQGK